MHRVSRWSPKRESIQGMSSGDFYGPCWILVVSTLKRHDMSCPTVDARISSFVCRQVHRLGSAPVACEEGVLAHSALRLMTHLVHVLPGYFSMRYREVTSNVDTIDIFDSTNKYEAGIGIKHMPEFIWVNHNHVS
jgi:hypothetical protein